MENPIIVRDNSSTDITNGFVLAAILTTLSYLVGIVFNWVYFNNIDFLEVFAVFTSYVCTWLCVKERRINYPFGALSTAAYAYLFYKTDLFASAILNLYLTPYLIYGWIRWRKDEKTLPVTRIEMDMVPIYWKISLVSYFIALNLSKEFNGTLAWTDSFILAGTLLAQFLMDNKKLENWIVWAVVNIFAIYTYTKTGLYLVAFQYIFFLGNTIYGYHIWKYDKNHVDR